MVHKWTILIMVSIALSRDTKKLCMHTFQTNVHINNFYNGIRFFPMPLYIPILSVWELYKELTHIYTSKQLDCNGLWAHIQGVRLCTGFTVVEMTRSHSVINTRFIRQPRLCYALHWTTSGPIVLFSHAPSPSKTQSPESTIKFHDYAYLRFPFSFITKGIH